MDFLLEGVAAGSGVGIGSTSISEAAASGRDWKMLDAMSIWPVLAEKNTVLSAVYLEEGV